MNSELLAYINQQRSFELPSMVVPKYKTGEYRDWKVTVQQPKHMIRGYFNGLQAPEHKNYVLSARDTGTVWMSLTPMELESHAYHVEWATGEVVVGGLGLGMYLYNIIRKPEVTKVWVVETSQSIIDAFMHFAEPESWDDWGKVDILHGDIKNMKGNDLELVKGADYLYVDIWATMMASEALEDMSRICEALEPKMSGWWCQEGDYTQTVIEARRDGEEPESHLDYAEERLREDYGIPTCGTRLPHGDQMLEAVVTNLMNM